MAIDFSKFNEMFPTDKLKKDMEEAAKNQTDFDKLPDGEYDCTLEKLELGESKSEKLMLKAQFRIEKGDHSNQCIFKNCVLTGTKNDGFMLLQAKKFLESLDSGVEIAFNGWDDFDGMLGDIIDAIAEDGLMYTVKVVTNKKNKDYQDITIVDILE